MGVYTAYTSEKNVAQPHICVKQRRKIKTVKRRDASKTRRARLFDGSVHSVHEQEKRSATQYYEVYMRFKKEKLIMRKPIIAGNWKMNNTASQGVALVNAIAPLVTDANCDVVVCVPAINIPAISEAIKGTNIKLGAENVHFAEKGAYTGEISAAMLLEYGVEYVIIGHSERRQYFGETDETVNKRTLTALANNITPIVCIGESLEERETGKTEAVLATQIHEGLKGIEDITKIVIAYEPVWAIGTGKTATAEQANETIAFIRKTVGEMFCPKCADALRIQYGGSMNAGNCKELMAMPEIDGGLIGGASLKAPDFAAIVNFDK